MNHAICIVLLLVNEEKDRRKKSRTLDERIMKTDSIYHNSNIRFPKLTSFKNDSLKKDSLKSKFSQNEHIQYFSSLCKRCVRVLFSLRPSPTPLISELPCLILSNTVTIFIGSYSVFTEAQNGKRTSIQPPDFRA